MRRYWLIILALLAMPVLVTAGRAWAGEPAPARTPMPAPAKGKGEHCVAPVEWMRRNHMMALKHQRDQTVHEGERGAKFSLKDCVSCHAVSGNDGRPVSVSDPKHFCRSCHDYAAVHIDCFECHASRPGEDDGSTQNKGAALSGSAADIAALEHYIESRQP